MTTPDQVHINQVRDALWHRPTSRASVMVGAGFSMNAERAGPGTGDLPSWHEVTKTICSRLYLPHDGTRLQDALAEASATSGFLKLAQEYEAAYGRNALHQLIKSLIRDDDFKPGKMHARLLRLPWRDVFTTNWDTLLESARIRVADRAYGVVRTAADISSAMPPRIVKLHGSFPSHYPFIITEEDYRTYPRKFAPFVNTVQKAMMETVFLLIGFSGDDPNFLHWSGWVRDNMGVSMPKIYLAGWLDLSAHRRHVLMERHVVPIDLAHHPKAAAWPEHLRHRYAADWILHTLEHGRPYDISDWPMPSGRAPVSVPELLQPVDVPTFTEPVAEPAKPSSSQQGNSLEAVRSLLTAWSRNRSTYPGWLTVPATKHDQLRWKTEEWEPIILRATPRFESIERLNAIRELVWRREMLLDRISSDLEQAASDVLKTVDCQARTVDGAEDVNVAWEAAREAWRAVALALVTSARQRLDYGHFEQRIEALSPFVDDHEDIGHTVHHERCLWALYALDFKTLSDLLRSWRTEACDPVWMLRKAAFLVEVHCDAEAVRLVSRALADIRENPGDGGSLAGPSREGWALFMAGAFEWNVAEWAESNRRWSRHYRRWTELARMHCDGLEEKRIFAERVRGGSKKEEKPGFDHGMEYQVIISSSQSARSTAARRAVRLTEVTALPPVANHMNISRDILELAADELASSEPQLASQLVLRICNYDEDPLLKRVYSRTRVAALTDDSVEAIADSCANVIEFALPRVSGERPGLWIERLRVAIEVLSRIVLRRDPHQVTAVFDKALGYYSNEAMAGHPWLTRPIRNLLARCWEALPDGHRTDRVLDVLAAPIVGMNGFMTQASARHSHVDAGVLLSDGSPPPPRTSENDHRWTNVISLLIQGLRSGGKARNRASIRIGYAGLDERFTETEKSQIADALWHQDYTPTNSLPAGTELYDWTFLLLPEPEAGLAAERFRRKWISNSTLENINSSRPEHRAYVFPLRSPENADPSDPNSVIAEVGSAISVLKGHEKSLNLFEEDHDVLAKIVNRWCETEIPPSFLRLGTSTRQAVISLHPILFEMRITESLAERLYRKVLQLHESKIPAFELIGGLIRALPDRLDELATMMRTGLVSDDVSFAAAAGDGLYVWIEESTEPASRLPPPPDDLIREVGIAIATRRKEMLEWALRIATLIFAKGSQPQRDTIHSLAVDGLNYLAGELRYDLQHDQEREDIDIPKLRWRCAQLAATMAEHLREQNPAVTRWLKVIEEDPLPEVRHAKPLRDG